MNYSTISYYVILVIICGNTCDVIIHSNDAVGDPLLPVGSVCNLSKVWRNFASFILIKICTILVLISKKMDTSMLDNHPALQAIRENETDDEVEQIQVKAVWASSQRK